MPKRIPKDIQKKLFEGEIGAEEKARRAAEAARLRQLEERVRTAPSGLKELQRMRSDVEGDIAKLEHKIRLWEGRPSEADMVGSMQEKAARLRTALANVDKTMAKVIEEERQAREELRRLKKTE